MHKSMGRFAANLFRFPGGRTASGAEKGMEADPFPTLAVCFVGNFGGPNFISGYYDRKVPAFAPPFLGGDVKNCG